MTATSTNFGALIHLVAATKEQDLDGKNFSLSLSRNLFLFRLNAC